VYRVNIHKAVRQTIYGLYTLHCIKCPSMAAFYFKVYVKCIMQTQQTNAREETLCIPLWALGELGASCMRARLVVAWLLGN
jgi:hypothetical protein